MVIAIHHEASRLDSWVREGVCVVVDVELFEGHLQLSEDLSLLV